MDNLKSIWQQLDCSVNQLGKLAHLHESNSVFEKLEKEAALRNKYNPFIVLFLFLFMAFFTYIIYTTSGGLKLHHILGIGLVFMASVIIITCSQVIKMPLEQFQHDKSSTDFLIQVKDKLNQSKKMLIVGIVLQNITLTLGLYLLIFYNQPTPHTGSLFTFLGFMFGLGGLAVGSAFAFFNQHYKGTYQTIDLFLKE